MKLKEAIFWKTQVSLMSLAVRSGLETVTGQARVMPGEECDARLRERIQKQCGLKAVKTEEVTPGLAGRVLDRFMGASGRVKFEGCGPHLKVSAALRENHLV